MSLFNTLCTPAKIYLILLFPLIISMFYRKFSVWNLVTLFIWAPIWTYLLNWLCSKGYSIVSWFLIFIPLIGAIVVGISYVGLFFIKEKE